MGLNLRDIVVSKEISISELSGKVCCVDSFNLLYQFITTIRSRDGTPLMDSKGNVTSHLVGVFSRITNLMQHGIRLAFVFDGQPPALKQRERERRRELKEQAAALYEDAKKREDVEDMRKYAGRTSRLTPEMIAEAKSLLRALGLPVIQAPSEGEAQAASMARDGNADFCVSQDFDALLHGTPSLLRNLSIAGRRKKANKLAYETVSPEVINLSENLNLWGIDSDHLIALALLIGTDYNPGGIKGIGPKNAIKLVKQHGSDFSALFSAVKWNDFFDFGWEEAFNTIKDMPTTKDYKLEWKQPDPNAVAEILVDRHDFSRERVEATLAKLMAKSEARKQRGLGEFV